MTIERIFYLLFSFLVVFTFFFLLFTHCRAVCGLQSQSAFCTYIPSSPSHFTDWQNKESWRRRNALKISNGFLWSVFIFYFSFQPMESNLCRITIRIHITISYFVFRASNSTYSKMSDRYELFHTHWNTLRSSGSAVFYATYYPSWVLYSYLIRTKPVTFYRQRFRANIYVFLWLCRLMCNIMRPRIGFAQLATSTHSSTQKLYRKEYDQSNPLS